MVALSRMFSRAGAIPNVPISEIGVGIIDEDT
jgi:hypothetical protein